MRQGKVPQTDQNHHLEPTHPPIEATSAQLTAVRETTPKMQQIREANSTVQMKGASDVPTCTCRIKIEGTEAFVLVDTGSMVTIVNPALVRHHERFTTGRPVGVRLKSASGHQIPILHEAKLEFKFADTARTHLAYICPDILQDAIIGFDFIRQHNLRINPATMTVQLENSRPIPLQTAEGWEEECAGVQVVGPEQQAQEVVTSASYSKDQDVDASRGLEGTPHPETRAEGPHALPSRGPDEPRGASSEDPNSTDNHQSEEAAQSTTLNVRTTPGPVPTPTHSPAGQQTTDVTANLPPFGHGDGSTCPHSGELPASSLKTDKPPSGEHQPTQPETSIGIHEEHGIQNELEEANREDRGEYGAASLQVNTELDVRVDAIKGEMKLNPTQSSEESDAQTTDHTKAQPKQQAVTTPDTQTSHSTKEMESGRQQSCDEGEEVVSLAALSDADLTIESVRALYTSERLGLSSGGTADNIPTSRTSADCPTQELDELPTTTPDEEQEEAITIGPVSPDQKEALTQLVDDFHQCFARRGELGACDLIEHRIELTSDVPVRRPAYKVAHTERKFVEKEIREMLAKGVIEPSISPYAAGVVLVPKKSGETRFCVDYRGLNEVTKADHYPIPLARSEIFDTLGGARIFSCLDCQQGYWQVSVAEEDRPKTAFRCFLGLYHFLRVPYGLRNAPATYQRLMAHVLSGYTGKFCHCFIDDIIIFSNNFEDHLEHLRLVFERLKQAGIKLKPSKCTLAKEQVQYLGHLISPGQLRPGPENISKISDLGAPSTVKEVRSFLGLASYYRSFVKDFSRRAWALTELTKQKTPFRWGPKEQEAFSDLKAALTSEPVLALPDFSKPFILMTDGSSTGLGAVLGQQQEGGQRERVISYASRRTTRLEENYSACELECLALVWATRQFREYILGRPTEVVTDHWALKWLQDLKNPNPRLQRWRMALLEYDLKITYKPGKQHRNADFLSRMYEGGRQHKERGNEGEQERDGHCKEEGGTEEAPEGELGVMAVITRKQAQQDQGREVPAADDAQHPVHRGEDGVVKEAPNLTKTGRQVLADLQRDDQDCQQLRQAMEQGKELPSWARKHQFRVTEDNVLERISSTKNQEERWQVVLPQSLVRSAVQDAHAGHLKAGKTLGNLRRSFFFKKYVYHLY